jgi:NADH:ubiquinone reductase (H+-translocating)
MRSNGGRTVSERRVIIVGGGFGGVTLAQHLERKVSSEVEIVLISSENHFVFTPMLAEVVGRSISPLHMAVAGRQMVRRTTWLTAQVTDIDLQTRVVRYVGEGGEHASLTYDHLVLACGSVVNMNMMPGLAAYAYPIKSLGDAFYLGNDLISRFEEAAVETDATLRRRLLTLVVIGGGFSGVEVAGAITEVANHALRFYPRLKDARAHIILLQHGNLLIPELNAPSLSTFAYDKLGKAGVDVRLNSGAQEVTAAGVRLKSGELIEAATVISTVGTSPNPLIEKLGLSLQHGRLVTNPDMSVTAASNVWALGDCAMVPNAIDQRPSPPTAQFAMRQAKQLAANLARTFRGQPTQPFSFRGLGMLASLGNRTAVAEILGIHISGFIAWILWRAIYLAKLPSLARRLEVLVDWTWTALFSPNIIQLQTSRTGSVGLAHYAPGEFVFHKGDPTGNVFAIQSGTAGVYLDQSAQPIVILKPGEHFGERWQSGNGRPVHGVSVKAETPLDLITIRRNDFERVAQTVTSLRAMTQRSEAALTGYEALMRMAKEQPRLASLTVSDVMSSPAETLSPDTSLRDAVRRFSGGSPAYPIVDEAGRLVGYCGRTELFDALRGGRASATQIREFMRKDPPVVMENQSLFDASVVLLRGDVDLLPVVSMDDNGKVVGVISPFEVVLKAIEPLSTDWTKPEAPDDRRLAS